MAAPARWSAFAALALAASAHAQVIWNEAIHGDLSEDRLAPTHLTLSLGTNSLLATSVAGDREYVRLTIPAGLFLNEIVHSAWTSVDQIAFIAVQAGPTFTEPPTGTNVANLLGYSHFGPGSAGGSTLGTNFLPRIGTGLGAIGFIAPLGPGEYTFWIQQTGPNASSYQHDFILVPAPGAALSLLGAGAFAITRRRRAH